MLNVLTNNYVKQQVGYKYETNSYFAAIIHRFVRDKYQKRFPELESLIVTPLEYIRTVKELLNDLDQVKYNETLQGFLTQATIMIVSVTASTTQG